MENKFCAVDYNVLNELRLEGSFLDVVFCVNGVEIPAHKNVLCCCSPYFRTLFSKRWNNKEKRFYNIPGVSPDMMEMIITFAYTQTVPITSDNVKQLLVVADQFNILGLINLCREFIESQLSPENCIGICRFAFHYCCPNLCFKAFRFILNEFEELVKVSDEFLQLSFFELCDILERDELNVKNESQVFHAVMKWISYQPGPRMGFVSELLPKVRLEMKDCGIFMQDVKKNEYINYNEKYKYFILRSLLKIIYDISINDSGMAQSDSSVTSSRLPFSILLSIGGWRGGHPTNSIEAYDARAKIWTDVTCEEETPKAYLGTAYLRGYVYFIGGFDSVEYYNMVCRFDPVNRVWQEVAPMHCRRGYISVVVLNNLIYAMGGFDGHNRLKTAEKYNAETNQWTLLSSMNERRSDASATTLYGKIYICGGFNGHNCLFTAEVYEPAVDQWSMIAPMMIERSGVGVIAYKDEVFAVGGFDGENRLDTAEAYNPQTDTWRSVSSMITPRSNFGIETMEDFLYVVGGYDGLTTSSKVESYNKETDEWKELPDMKLDRSALSCCVLYGLPNVREYVARRQSQNSVSMLVERQISPFYSIPPV
ncbi:kelch-like protein 10 [Polypterus senegalus]|uniref:kelch-like protein 10 n=1 Tax=Polypterus senegalus TaxID=55291 RepID=UPI001965145A|nr:kelch-like protein 10 [Polypterus senegalus]